MTSLDDDPFRFLEDAADPRTIAWTAEQNARTRRVLEALPARARLLRRFEQLLEIDTLGPPVVRGPRAFYTARRGAMEQSTLYVRERGQDRPLIDPAVLDPGGLTALDWWYPSPSGTFVAFGLSKNGDERSTLFVIDVAGGERRAEAIPDTRYCSLAWLEDESGFYYTRYPSGAEYAAHLYRHRLGDAWSSDRYLFGAGRKPEEMVRVALSASGRWLAVVAFDGWARSDAYVADTRAPELRFEAVAEGCDAVFDVLPADDTLYVRTDEGAPRFRVFAVDPANPVRAGWREIVPETRSTLEAVGVLKGGLALHYLEDVSSVVRIRRDDGSLETIDAFASHSVLDWTAYERDEAFYVLHASFFQAPGVLRVEMRTNGSTVSVWERVPTPLDAGAYRAEQVWCTSRDGTAVPMFVLARGDTPRDGTAPAVLYGYGGFNVSVVPTFSPSIFPWLDAGGVYAIANLRGGGEYGEEWHRAGMRECKQNVFDDFIAAAEYLGTSRIADSRRIATMGGSNGGLLVAAVATQRPALARAVVCLVPLTDMLRFADFSIARLWIPELGDPADPADATFLRAYSPYHNVVDGTAYPPMLIVTAESDGRVDPMHARKFGARLAAAQGGDAPILVFVEEHAGHGAGKPRGKVVAELADRWSFIAWQLSVEVLS